MQNAPIRKSTLKDIADELGISISTASRALKGHARISKAMQEKVKRTALRLGYVSRNVLDVQNPKSSNLIGVIVPGISYHLYAMAITGIESIAEANGMHIIVCQSKESYVREKSLVEELLRAGVNGIIASLASETKDFTHFRQLQKKGIPLVFFNRECNDVFTDKVTIDNVKAAYEAVEHLLSVGCKRIAYLGGPEVLQINSDRARGYSQALADNALEYKHIAYSKFDRESTLSTARKLLYAPNYPDAILTFSDQIAISVMLVAKERGIIIPEQLSLIGFNNEPVDELLEPSLTSVDQPAYDMGEEAARMLLKQVRDFDAPRQKIILRSHLVVRESTNKNRKVSV